MFLSATRFPLAVLRPGVVRLAVLGWLLAAGTPAAALEVPPLSARVNDYANLIGPEVEQGLEAKLAALEQETGAQLAVLTIPSLEGDPLEDFSIRVVETWELGRQGVDDGVLLLVSHQDRKVRIEVGYGLEGTLTDLDSRRIISNVLVPHFRRGEFDAGIAAAVDVLAGTIRGQEDLIPPDPGGSQDFAAMPAGEKVAFLGIFIVVIGLFSLIAATAPGAAGWFLYVFLMPFYLAFPAAVFGCGGGLAALVFWIVALPVARRFMKSSGYAGKLGRSGGGWQWSGGGWSGGGFSSGGSFGGFSGGGGSFGGGGASGSW